MTQQDPNHPLVLPFSSYGGIYIQILISWRVVGQQHCVPTADANLGVVWWVPMGSHHPKQGEKVPVPSCPRWSYLRCGPD